MLPSTLFIDARTLGAGAALTSDVCIIGAGPAGITLALELMSAGARVLVLEAGGEEGAQPSRLEGSSSDHSYRSLAEVRATGFAGTSNLWNQTARWRPDGWLRCLPLAPIDFEARPWLPNSGWPFGLEHLLPYYERANQVLGLGPFDYSVEEPIPGPMRAPLMAASRAVETPLFRFAHKDTFRSYRESLASAPNVDVLLNAQAMDLELAEGSDRVHRVRVSIGTNAEIGVSARVFVLAGGGIENARLLLLSRGRYMAGLGNGNDLVGRYFMEHLQLLAGELQPKTPGWGRSLDLYRRHEADGVAMTGGLKLSDQTRRDEQILGVVISPRVGHSVFNTPSFASFSSLVYYVRSRKLLSAPLGHFASIARHPWAPLWGSYLLLRKREDHGSYFGLHAHFEQPPRPENRVQLAEERDELGLPRAEVHWSVGADELRSLRRTYELIGAELNAAGIATLKPGLRRRLDKPLHSITHHHMGTTRMHVDPRHGVVDENSRVHGVANLFVAGSSVFPTGGAATATLTLVALTIRLGDYLRRELAGKERVDGSAGATTFRTD